MYIQDFGQLATPACTRAIGSTQTLQLFGGTVARPPTITPPLSSFASAPAQTFLTRAKTQSPELAHHAVTGLIEMAAIEG
jgi:hypothetical protein